MSNVVLTKQIPNFKFNISEEATSRALSQTSLQTLEEAIP